MLFLFQATLFLFITLSFLLVIGVPVAFASPNGFTNSKNILFSSVTAWIVLLFAIGILNSFI